MKKHLALIMALVMVLGSFSFVSAAPDFSDVKDTPAEEAIMSLELLNVLKGYPDGTFKPANTITRAEFAAVAVRVSGLEQVAVAAKGLPTGFNDVPAWHWASGYIGTAAKMGIVNGIGNGMFAPASPVKYEEAITMVVRALGYEPAAQAKGGYPFGYLIVANEIDLLDGAMGTQGTWATRAFVAQITFNALEIPMMIQDGFGTDARFIVSGTNDTDEKYLIEQMGFKSVEGRVTDYDNDDMEIEMNVTEKNGVALDNDEDNTYDVVEGFDFYRVHGVTVKAWLDGDKVLLTKLVDDVMFDAVDFDASADTSMELITADKDYDIAEDDDMIITKLILDNDTIDFTNEDEDEFAADFMADYAKVVLDGGDVVWAEGVTFADDAFLLVEEVDDMDLVGYDRELDVEDYLIVKDGKTIAASEVMEGDLVIYNEDYEYSEYVGIAVVANMTEEGVVTTAYVVSDNADTDAFKLDGTMYDLSELGAVYVDDDALVAVDTDALAGYEDEEETITIYLDYYGNVVVMMGEMANVTSTYGAILTEEAEVFNSRGDDKIAWDLVNEMGEEVSFDEDVADTTLTGANMHDVVEYTLDEDGDLDEAIKLLTTASIRVTDNDFEIDDRYAEGYRLQSDTVVFLLDGDDVDEVFVWADAEDFFGEVTDFTVYGEAGEATYLVVYDSDAAGDFDEYYGVLVSNDELANGDFEAVINIEGTEYDFDVTTTGAFELGDFVKVSVNVDMDELEDDELLALDVDDPAMMDGEFAIVSARSETFTIDDSDTLELISAAVVLDGMDAYDSVDFDDINVGDTVKVLFDGSSGRYVQYVVITAYVVD